VLFRVTSLRSIFQSKGYIAPKGFPKDVLFNSLTSTNPCTYRGIANPPKGPGIIRAEQTNSKCLADSLTITIQSVSFVSLGNVLVKPQIGDLKVSNLLISALKGLPKDRPFNSCSSTNSSTLGVMRCHANPCRFVPFRSVRSVPFRAVSFCSIRAVSCRFVLFDPCRFVPFRYDNTAYLLYSAPKGLPKDRPFNSLTSTNPCTYRGRDYHAQTSRFFPPK
jgi:hypothetical protein